METLALFGGRRAVTSDANMLRTRLTEEEIDGIIQFLKADGLYTLSGDGVIKEFEERSAKYFGRFCALATNNCTSALLDAFLTLDLCDTDEIIIPAYGYPAAAHALLYTGAKPVVVDIEDRTLNIDPCKMEETISNATKAILVVNMWGIPGDFKRVREVAKRHNLVTIEDASRSVGASRKGLISGKWADISCLSINTYKIIGAGEGGLFLTDNTLYHDRAIILGQSLNPNIKRKSLRQYIGAMFGMKHKIHPVAAFIGLKQLETLDYRMEQCRNNYNYLWEALSEFRFLRRLQFISKATRGAWSGFCAFYDNEELDGLDKKIFLDALQAEGCKVLPEYESDMIYKNRFKKSTRDPSWLHPYSKHVAIMGTFPVAKKVGRDLVLIENICSYTRDAKDIIDQYTEAILKVIRHKDKLLKLQAHKKCRY
jgi:perosamine synthetase